MSAKCRTGFTHAYLPLIGDYLRVLSTRQDSLTSICYSLVITCEYKIALQELLTSIFNSSVIARKQCSPCVVQAQHMSYLQNFSRHKALQAFLCKLGWDLCCKIAKGGPIPLFSDTFDTKYRAEYFTDSDININPYSYIYGSLYQSLYELYASRHISSSIYKAL